MQITEISVAGLKREFKVVIPAQEIDAQVQAKLQDLIRTVKLPGFRPGKIPLAVVTKRFGGSVIKEVVEKAVSQSAKQATSERGLRLAVQPVFRGAHYNEGNDLEYTLEVEEMPDIEPGDFGAIALERPVTEVTDELVGEMLRKLADQMGASEPMTEDRGAAEGDVLLIDFAGTVDGESMEGMSAQAHELPLGKGTFLPDFEAGLMGSRAGEHRQLKVEFPADYQEAGVAGRQAIFEVDIKELRSPVVMQIDDEMAKRFGLDDLDALLESARSRLKEEFAELSRRRLKRILLDKLALEYTFLVPPSMVDVELAAVWNQWEREKLEGRLSADEVGRDEETVKAEYRGIAERRVRLALLIAEVGRRNNIRVTPEEIKRAMIEEARRYPGHEREVIELYQKNEQAIEGLRAPLFEDKVVDFVLELVRVTDRTVSMDELRREPNEAVAA